MFSEVGLVPPLRKTGDTVDVVCVCIYMYTIQEKSGL